MKKNTLLLLLITLLTTSCTRTSTELTISYFIEALRENNSHNLSKALTKMAHKSLINNDEHFARLRKISNYISKYKFIEASVYFKPNPHNDNGPIGHQSVTIELTLKDNSTAQVMVLTQCPILIDNYQSHYFEFLRAKEDSAIALISEPIFYDCKIKDLYWF